ncbi:leucyl aminopeptidase [Exiguobacterium acetylicum]|uniref:leucyl aminopeptidase n=1 Tax=Exiguobacterium acetylicum TaxID=41170 RepID=UPI001CA66B66|nr:leucyl aminopeptidase [Exiguobacterium acetylicum]QZY86117.1 leucyl aminopeptidase [Exiguobacterium acetylicum]
MQTNQSVDVLVVGISGNQPLDERLQALYGDKLEEWVRQGDISTKRGELRLLPTLSGDVARVLFVGLGKVDQLSQDELRRLLGKAAQHVKARRLEHVTVDATTFPGQPVELIAETFTLATYEVKHYKTSPSKSYTLQLTVLPSDDEAVLRGTVLGEATNLARRLVTMPGNLLTAPALADEARFIAERHGHDLRIIDKEEMEALGMGALLAVNQGSVIPPKLIVLEYKGSAEAPIAVVGKGVTFDTGGYSIKPKDGIVGMKGDMGGAAAVLGLFEALGQLKPDVHVIGVIPATDNMISGDAFKPDDVITSMAGKTIEVLNTDAEGRLVLADAVTYVKEYQPKAIIDLATLTGGVLVALGTEITGALTNDASLYERFEQVTKETNEMVWQMPYVDAFIKQVRRSEVADLNNSPGRMGHMIFGGAFVGEFVGDTPWLHLDIAGTSEQNQASEIGPKGATGVMVRSLYRFVEQEK